MEAGGSNNPKPGTDSQDSDDHQLSGTSGVEKTVIKFSTQDTKLGKNFPLTSKGVEQAKKRLRAFSIQKKTSLSPVSVAKPSHSSGNVTVIIGKATGVKSTPKPTEPDQNAEPKKPKPPKPGAKHLIESYMNTQKKTLAEIEDMKRQMELVELGIPLGLICPAPNSDKAMPTKAMPPIKTFLDDFLTECSPRSLPKHGPQYVTIYPDRVDDLIREAKKAKAEGKEFKFDYRKLLPDYANPFQRKKDGTDTASETLKAVEQERKSRDKDRRRSDKNYDIKRQSSYKSADKDRYREDKHKDRDDDNVERDKPREKGTKYKDRDYKYKERDNRSKEGEKERERDNRSKEREHKKDKVKKESVRDEKEAEVNLKDFVVCDSWSDNEDKSKDSTPKPEEIKKGNENTPILLPTESKPIDTMLQLCESLSKQDQPKIEKLKPVMDSFKFEIEDPDDDDVLDMFDENSPPKRFSKVKPKKELAASPIDSVFDYDDIKDETFEGMADDTFLESVINEIKQEEIDENSQDKGLVEYDESPSKDEEIRGSVTPEMDEKTRQLHSSRSDYSDGYKSTESGYKSTDSLKIGYKSDGELERIVEERRRELEMLVDDRKMQKCTVDSLETWSFVLKICQPLLFRHDRNKCYKETRVDPKLWYTENPKVCNCVKDRAVVYEELEMCKMELVDALYGAKKAPEPVEPTSRKWYPRLRQCLTDTSSVPVSNEWEVEDSQAGGVPAEEPGGDVSLDKEYRRFMEAVWPEVAEAKSETPRSSPVRREATKKKAEEDLDTDKKKAKKMKMSSEGWSQESDVEEQVPDKSYNALQDFLYEALHYEPNTKTVVKKVKLEKEKRKRKHSTSTSVTDSSESEAKKKKMQKKKAKKLKFKDAKRRRVSKKNVKKLKEKQKKKKKIIEIEEDSDAHDLEKEKKKKEKKLKKKKLLKQKKKNQKKKKAKAKSSSSSDSSSDSEPEPEKKSKKKKKTSEKKKKRKKTESKEELFDVNILKNIKTERETDDEISKQLEFSPRRQKPREIIDVKELQSDFVGNSIQIKKEVEEEERRKEEKNIKVLLQSVENKEDSIEFCTEKVVEEKEPQIDLKEQEESQSTPQLRPDESNNSQCSSQESIYSLKDQPIYEKDESHLRPSSQNSNYSFHDVMASGKNKIDQDKQRYEHDMITQGHDSQSHSQDMRSHERDTRSHEYNMDMREHDVARHEHNIPSHEHKIQSLEHDPQRYKHENRGHDINYAKNRDNEMRSGDVQRHEYVMKSHEHDTQSHEHEMRHQRDLQSYKRDLHRHEHEIQRHEHEIENHEHEIHSHENEIQSHEHQIQRHEHEMQSHEHAMQSQHDMDSQEYEQGNYEMYEQMAMAYQSDVASQRISPPDGSSERRIETVVRARCGEIKCDWRAGDSGAPRVAPHRPSRWGLKPNEVNIVLTGGEQYPPAPASAPAPAPAATPAPAEPVYKIRSLANRSDNSNTGYDEAYMDMYGAADKLQYGDCFSTDKGEGERRPPAPSQQSSTLDDRINLALRTTVLGEVAKDLEETEDKDGREKGILVTKSLSVESRAPKRVSFADGYKPGQDSDVEEPPVKKKKKARRVGCPWPCPATHPDHVTLWDALPPPPPPPGSPPPPAAPRPPPAHLLRAARTTMPPLLAAPVHAHKFDPSSLPAFMPPEPPAGLISFQHM